MGKSSLDSIDRYWAETGLNYTDLVSLINTQNCQSSEKRFLGCAYGVHRIAQKIGLSFYPPNILTANDNGSSVELSEKEYIQKWIPMLNSKREIHFDEALAQLKSQISQEKSSAAVAAGMNAYLSIVKDPHTYLLPAKYYKEIISQPAPEFPSLGVAIVQGKKGYFVRKVLQGSLADQSGMLRGDYIRKINGHSTRGLTQYQISELIRAEENEVTALLLERDSKLIELQILRKKLAVNSVTHKIYSGSRKLGVITINKFAQETCQQTEIAIRNLKSEKVEGILLDLRDNSGGIMDEATCVVSLFVGSGKLVYNVQFLDPTQEEESAYTSEPQLWSGPLAVLVNSGSASSSEIVAGALRDIKGTPLIGERTFGKGSFQEGEIWSKNGKIALFQTSGIYYLPSGFTPQLKGLRPDVEIQSTESVSLREEDQYVSSITPRKKQVRTQMNLVVSANCLVSEKLSSDPELNSASSILFCKGKRIGGTE